MKKILFICTGNTCRSPMAQGMFNSICQEENLPYLAESAGLCTLTGIPVSPNSAAAMLENGVDICDFTATSIEDKDIDSYDVIAVMTPEHKQVLMSYGVPAEKIYVLAESSGGISDPYGGSLQRYRQCCCEIESAVRELLKELV